MKTMTALALAVTAGVSAGAGWMARGPALPAGPLAGPADVRPAAVPPAPAADTGRPLIAVSADGQVTLRVDQQPLDWVLEQIALQSGRADLRAAVGVAAAASSVPTAAPAQPAAQAEGDVDAQPAVCGPMPPADAAQLVRTIEHGDDDARIPALLRARTDGVPVPESVLRAVMENAPTDRARLVALDSWLEMRAGDPMAERAALEAALLVPNEALQREARQRLDDLNETERLDALAAQGSP